MPLVDKIVGIGEHNLVSFFRFYNENPLFDLDRGRNPNHRKTNPNINETESTLLVMEVFVCAGRYPVYLQAWLFSG